jgi:hypothetical protein
MNDADFNKLIEAEKKHFYRCVCGEMVDKRQFLDGLIHDAHMRGLYTPKLDWLKLAPLGVENVAAIKAPEGGATGNQHGKNPPGGIISKDTTTDDDESDNEESAEAPRWVPVVKTICEVVKTLGLLAIGFWAVYTFWVKKDAETAVAQYQILQLQRDEAQKKAHEFVTAKIRPESIEKVPDGYIVILSLHLANKGGTDHELAVGDHSIRLARVEFNGKDGPADFIERQFSPVRSLSDKNPEKETAIVNSLALKSGAEDARYLCFFHVIKPGVYYAEFKAHYGNGLLLSNASFPVGPDQAKTSSNNSGKSVEVHE